MSEDFIATFASYCESSGGDKLPADCLAISGHHDEQGWGHHAFAVIAKNAEGYWMGESSGCSCRNNTAIVGPCETYEEALSHMSEWQRELLESP